MNARKIEVKIEIKEETSCFSWNTLLTAGKEISGEMETHEMPPKLRSLIADVRNEAICALTEKVEKEEDEKVKADSAD